MQRLGPLFTVLTLLALAGAARLLPSSEHASPSNGWISQFAPMWAAAYSAAFTTQETTTLATCEPMPECEETRVIVLRCASQVGPFAPAEFTSKR